MKVGDLVRNLNSESGMTGIIVGWHENGSVHPQVLWADGRCSWIMRHRVEASTRRKVGGQYKIANRTR